MKAEELRIGNYVNYNDGSGHDDIRKIVGIDQNSVTSIVKGCHFATAIKSNDLIYPIPLSESVLLKCGFVKDDFSKTYVRYSIGNFNIIHDTDKGIFICDGIKYTLVCVQHLHQLQNLYYALTGEELEINL